MSTRRSRTITLTLGTVTVTLTPHIIDGIGARVMMGVEERGMRWVVNLAPDHARSLGSNLTLATCEAESIERREQRRKEHAA